MDTTETSEHKELPPLSPATGSGDVLQLWRSDEAEIKLVKCPDGGWPANDENHHRIYQNTHWKNPEDAWDKTERELASRIELTLDNINRAAKHLNKLKDDLVEASLLQLKAKNNRQAWNRQNADLSGAK